MRDHNRNKGKCSAFMDKKNSAVGGIFEIVFNLELLLNKFIKLGRKRFLRN